MTYYKYGFTINFGEVIFLFKLSDTSKKLIKVMLAICLIALGAGVIVTGIWFPDKIFKYVYGIIFGTLFAVLKLILLERSITKTANMAEGQAQNYMRLHYMMRYFLTAAVLVVAALKDRDLSVFIGVFLSLMSLRPAIHIVNWQMKKTEEK